MTAPPLAWTVAQAAQELQISKGHLYRLVKEKRIPYFRAGVAIRFSPARLAEWVAEREVEHVK